MRVPAAAVTALVLFTPVWWGTAHAEPAGSGAAGQTVLHALSSPNERELGLFGRSVSGVPDVDGDGIDELLVGADGEAASGGPDGSGLAHVFSGATGEVLRTLASPNEELGGGVGYSVAGVPDVDVDGGGDLLVGAPFEDAGASSTGRAYLFSGATGTLLRTLVSPGPEFAGFFGRSVASVPGATGAGVLAVGAPSENGGDTNSGRVHVFSATTGALLRTIVSPTPEQFGDFGGSVSGVRDVNGDGHDELLVGANEESQVAGPRYAGRAHLFSGSDGDLLHTLRSPAEQPSGFFGTTVSGIPDVDGDGGGDLLVGELPTDPDAGLPSTGTAYVFSGATGDVLHELVSPSPSDFGAFAQAVAGVPDVDGDGRGDLLIGAPGEPGLGVIGRAYVFSGAGGSLLQTLASPNEDGGTNFGFAVAGVDDIDGDGRGELLVGAYGEDRGASRAAGRAYAFSGGPAALLFEITVTVNSPVARGDRLELSLVLTNRTPDDLTGDLRLRIRTPSGSTSTIVLASGATIGPGQTARPVFGILAAADAPLGRYDGIVGAVSDGRLVGADLFAFDVAADMAVDPAADSDAEAPFGPVVVLADGSLS